MTAVTRRRQRRQRSSLVVYIDIVGGEAMRAALTLMHVSTPVCHRGSSRMVSSQPVLGRVIRRADTGSHTQQPLITVDDVTMLQSLSTLLGNQCKP